MAGTRWTRCLAPMGVALALVLLGWFNVVAQAGGKTDKEKLQGNWIVLSAMKGGEEIPEMLVKTIKATFKGDKVSLEFAGDTKDGVAKMDESKKPKTIDLTVGDMTLLGIYEVEGTRLKVCLGEPGQARPTKFEAPAGTETILVIFTRPKGEAKDKKKEEKKPNANPGAVLFQGDKKDKGDKKGKTDKELLQGSWALVSGVKNGQDAPQDIVDKFKMTFTGDKVALEVGVAIDGSFKIDSKTKPKSMDLTIMDKEAKGIYQIEGDTLKICIMEPGNDGRPKEFKAPAGSQCTYMVLKRAKPACADEQPVLFVPISAQGDKKDKKDKGLFQGSWKVVEGEHNGMKLPQDFLDGLKLSFKGDKVNMEFMGMGKEGDFKLDPTTKPKSIDMTIDGKPGKGIYQIDGDTLKICIKIGDGERPTKFEAGADSNNGLMVLKREKAAKKEEKKAGAVQFTPADFASCCADEGGDKAGKKTDKDSFQGSWDVTAAEKGGEKIGEDMLNGIKIKFAGDKLVLDLFGTKSEGTFKLDPTKKPRTIDLTLDDKTSQGIYELNGDSLKIVLAEPGQPRPKDFNGTAGTESAMVSLKRGKAAPGEKKEKEKKTATPKEEGKAVKTNPVQGAPDPMAKKTDQEGLQGVWKMVSLEVSGKKMDASELAGMRLIFKGEKVTVITGSSSGTEEGTFRLDPTKKLRQLDITLLGKTMQAIYQLDGDKLTICGSEPGQEKGRPTGFKTTAETKRGLLVLQRAKNERPDGFAANAQVSINNLKQIVLAMHNYHGTYNKLPGAAIYSKDGKPLLSWRVAILPYVEQQALYQQFKLDEPWDSEHNKKLIPLMPRLYTPYTSGDQRKTMTPYRVFTGKGTLFEGFKKDIKFQDVTDGTSNTIMVVEGADQVPWTKPEDFPFDPKKDLPKLGGLPFSDRFHLAMADGSVRSVNAEFDAMIFRALITRDGGEVIDLDKLEKPKKAKKSDK